MRSTRWLTVKVVAGAVVAGAVLWSAGPADAHVTAETTAVGADGTSTVAFSFEHGCEGEATDGLRVALPAGAAVVTTQEPSGWQADVQAGEIAWTGTAIADGEPGEFAAVIRSDAPEGEPLRFPVVQVCGDAELAWIDEDPESSNPAPAIAWAVVGEEGVIETTATAHSHGTSPAVIVAAVVVALALVGLVVWLVVRRRQPST